MGSAGGLIGGASQDGLRGSGSNTGSPIMLEYVFASLAYRLERHEKVHGFHVAHYVFQA